MLKKYGFYIAAGLVTCIAVIIAVSALVKKGESEVLPQTTVPAAADSGISLRLSQEKATELLRENMPDGLYLSDVTLVFSKDDGIIIAGTADLRRAAAENPDVAGSLKNLSALLPSAISFSASLAVSANNGRIAVAPVKVDIAGFTLPAALITPVVGDAISKAVESFASDAGMAIKSITADDGYLTVGLD